MAALHCASSQQVTSWLAVQTSDVPYLKLTSKELQCMQVTPSADLSQGGTKGGIF